MQDEINKLVASVGAMAEMTALYRKGLLDHGIPPAEAVKYTAAFITAVIGGGKSGQA